MTLDQGMAKSQCTQLLLSMPACADAKDAMQDLNDITYMTSDQHKDATKTKKTKDDNDNPLLFGFLQD